MFQRKRIKYDDKNGSNYYGLNVPNNQVQMNTNPDRVYIAMPQNLSTQYAPTYKTVDMGVTGMAAASGLKSEGFDDLAKALQQAAKDAIPEFTAGALSEVASGAAQAAGIDADLYADSIAANEFSQKLINLSRSPESEAQVTSLKVTPHVENTTVPAGSFSITPEAAQKNYGTGRDGTFGAGTSGKGRPSDPNKSFIEKRPTKNPLRFLWGG